MNVSKPIAAVMATAFVAFPALNAALVLQNRKLKMELSAADFKLFENGRPQKISFFDAGSGLVSLAVLVDSSSSMIRHGRLGSAQAIAAQFTRIAGPGDEVFSMDFTDRMGPFERLTPEQLLNPSIAPAVPPSQGSALYDAIASSICHLSASKNPRQAVIVVTDGIDQHSRLTLDQLISLVRSSPAQLFMIGLQSRPEYRFQKHADLRLTLISGQDIDNPVVVLDRLMKESSAESFIPDSESGIEQALQAVSNMLHSEYTLAYYPQRSPAEKSLKIRVKVNRYGARVLTRHSIGSGLRGEPIHFEQPACTVSPKLYPHPYELRLAKGPQGMTYREDFSDRHTGWPVHSYERYVEGAYELVNLESPVEQTTPYLITGQNLPLTFQKT